MTNRVCVNRVCVNRSEEKVIVEGYGEKPKAPHLGDRVIINAIYKGQGLWKLEPESGGSGFWSQV